MRPILAGLDTEYGFSVEGRGAEDQIDDAKALVRSFPGERIFAWDYSAESPRNDLRGFKVDALASDPEDAKFDAGRRYGPADEVRSDLVLANGARLYNDHGHPEYATPETWSLAELALHDKAGDRAVVQAAAAFQESVGRDVRVYKNNTDFHGASYGTHESYLVPRAVTFEKLVNGLMPLLVVRQVLCGAGKVGSEHGRRCDYQMSQRADFFVEPFSAETLYRRPVFNTRDEPHADPRRWIRLHVICGESNMVSSAVRRKAGLVKLALHLIEADECPVWALSDPVRSFQAVSRDPDGEGRVELEGRSWTTPRSVLESYLEAAGPLVAAELPDSRAEELQQTVVECLELLEARFDDPDRFAKSVDWAAKRSMLKRFAQEEGLRWRDPAMQSLDLEYHRIDGGEGLFPALLAAGAVDPGPDEADVALRQERVFEPTRAFARSVAVRKFKERIKTLSWGSVVFETDSGPRRVDLPPDREYPATLERCETVEELIIELEADHDPEC
ncbi:MAG: proteasome accessory factor PafA2 family protein [Armatimonadetes bacterium]|nr:proteasome accessory factor PafA2 family protein [Armatimonadota bacterium]